MREGIVVFLGCLLVSCLISIPMIIVSARWDRSDPVEPISEGDRTEQFALWWQSSYWPVQEAVKLAFDAGYNAGRRDALVEIETNAERGK